MNANSPGQLKWGDWGEERFREELKAAKKRGEIQAYFRPEWLVIERDGSLTAREVKTQESYAPPPFRGHGLPGYQAEKYLRLHEHGIPTLLVVYDEECRREAWIHELEARGPSCIYTTTNSRRRIYEIGGFKQSEAA